MAIIQLPYFFLQGGCINNRKYLFFRLVVILYALLYLGQDAVDLLFKISLIALNRLAPNKSLSVGRALYFGAVNVLHIKAYVA